MPTVDLYYRCSVFQLKYSITDEAVKHVFNLILMNLPKCIVLYAVKCLRETYSAFNMESQYTVLSNRLAVKHLFASIQVMNRVNEYLLKSIRMVNRKMLFVSIAFANVSNHGHCIVAILLMN